MRTCRDGSLAGALYSTVPLVPLVLYCMRGARGSRDLQIGLHLSPIRAMRSADWSPPAPDPGHAICPLVHSPPIRPSRSHCPLSPAAGAAANTVPSVLYFSCGCPNRTTANKAAPPVFVASHSGDTRRTNRHPESDRDTGTVHNAKYSMHPYGPFYSTAHLRPTSRLVSPRPLPTLAKCPRAQTARPALDLLALLALSHFSVFRLG